MKISKAILSDLEEVTLLFDAYRVFYEKTTDLIAAKEFMRARLTQNDSEIFIAQTTDNIVVGFVQLYPLFSSTRMQKLWLLNDLYVNDKYRGQGVSIALINKAKEMCKASNACGIMLETAKSNLIGNKLYPKTDFKLDTDHNYYSWDCT